MTLWRDVLRRQEIGAEDDFFLSGGDSLAAVSLLLRIEERLGSQMSLQDLMQNGSPRKLAERLQRGSSGSSEDTTGIHTDGSRPPLFAIGGRFGYVLRLLPLGQALGPNQPFYALNPPGMDWKSVGCRTIPQMAAHYIERVLAIQPKGPFRLVGSSFGGLMVYEMALQLQAAGHEVELLCVIDTEPAIWGWFGGLKELGLAVFLKEFLRNVYKTASIWSSAFLWSAKAEGSGIHFLKKTAQTLRPNLGSHEAAGYRVAYAQTRARDLYRMEGCYKGEILYFLCEISSRPRGPDLRGLWSAFATRTRFIPVPGRHGECHREPQLGVLCRELREQLAFLQKLNAPHGCREDIPPSQSLAEQSRTDQDDRF